MQIVSIVSKSIARCRLALGDRLRRWMFRTGIGPVAYLVRLTIILVLLAFFVIPLWWMAAATTKTDQQLRELPPLAIGSLDYVPQVWGYIMMFYDGVVVRWIQNSFVYVVAGLTLSLFTSIPAGFVLAVIPFRLRKPILWLTILTMLVPADALVLPMYLELHYFRLLDTPWALILPAAAYPVGVYLTFQYYRAALPPDIVAAARVDGCSYWQMFWHIALPLARNIIGVLAFTNFAQLWSNFYAASILIDKTQYKTLAAGILIWVQNCQSVVPAPNRCILPADGHLTGRAELALLGTIATLPVLIIYLFAQRLVIRGVTAGAVKE